MTKDDNKEYYAFISYSHKDEEWAKWLQHEFEHYHLPTTLNGQANVPDKFRPIFRDTDELSGGELKPQISCALRASSYLVIICSPNSAKSSYVNGEIREFIEIGEQCGVNNIANIFPFIIEGIPHSKDEPDKECFPEVLRNLPSELIAGDVTKHGREHAFVKILSGTLHHSKIGFGILWNQFERDRIEAERIEREKHDRLLIAQSRFVAEKAMSIAEEDSYLARLLALEVLPKDLENPDRPYTVEAERALRKSSSINNLIIRVKDDNVISAVFSRDGKHIITVCEDKNLHILDSETGKELQIIYGQCDYVSSAVFSPDRTRVVSVPYPRIQNNYIWDAETGEVLSLLQTHEKTICFAVFSPEGTRIASSSSFHDDTIRIWDAKTGVELQKIEDNPFVKSIYFSSDGMRIVSASLDKNIRIWDVKTGALLKAIQGNHGFLSAVFSPDELHIVSVSSDGDITIWDAESGKMIKVLDKNDSVELATYNPDGSRIITISHRQINVWDAETGEELDSLKFFGITSHPVFSPDGKRIVFVCHHDTIHVRTLETGYAFKYSLGHAIISPTLSPDGMRLIFANETTICILDLVTGQELNVLKGHGAKVESVNISPDGKRIVSASADKTIRIWDAVTGKELNALEGHVERVCSADFCPDGTQVISASEDGTIRIWSAETGQELRVLYSYGSNCYYQLFYTYSYDGTRIVAIIDSHIYLWDAKTGKELADSYRYQCNAALFSPDGTRIMFLSDKKAVEIINIEKWIKLKEHSETPGNWNGDSPTEIVFDGYDAVYSPDGKLIIIGTDDKIILWDVETGKVFKEIQHAELRRHLGASIFAPNGICFFYIGNKGIHIWNIKIGEDIMVLTIPPGSWICNVSFSNDGRQVRVVCANGTIRIWDFPPLQDLINQTRERFKDRPLTPEERKQFYLE